MEKKYYKAKLCVCDKNLKYLKKGKINFSEIINHIKIKDIDLIMEIDKTRSIEYLTKEELPLLFFNEIKSEENSEQQIDFVATLGEDYVTTFAICFESFSCLPSMVKELNTFVITKEQADSIVGFDAFELGAEIVLAKKEGEFNLNKKEKSYVKQNKMLSSLHITE